MQKLYNWLAREDGQTMAEYGVVLVVITIAVRRTCPPFGQHRTPSAASRGYIT